MTLRTLIRRSLRFHWRSHLGVVIGAAIGSTALIGALAVGDSVKGSLRQKALDRLGGAWVALDSGNRFFQQDLTVRMFLAHSNQVAAAPGASADALSFSLRGDGQLGPVLISLPANIAKPDGSSRANRVSLYAIDPAGWPALHGDGAPSAFGDRNEVWLNAALAEQLGVGVGDPVIVRLNKPAIVALEAPISPRADATIALRTEVGGILPSFLGNLSLTAGATAPMNVFARRDLVEKAIGMEGRGNLMLLSAAYRWRDMTTWDHLRINFQRWKAGQKRHPLQTSEWLQSSADLIRVPGSGQETVALASNLLAQTWTLEDAECEWGQPIHLPPVLELKTSRVFLDPPVEHAALAADTNARPILTYIANLITSGTNATPYSMVTAAGAPWTPPDLGEDEIVLNQWLADDLQAGPGDGVTLRYYDPESGGRLIERTNRFRVHSVVPMTIPWADRTLMPDLPGIQEAERTADWDTAFPLTYRIRSKDDDYWRDHRGTPKAFVTLAAGKTMWGNRFGEVTAVRFPIPTNEMARTHSVPSPTEDTWSAAIRVPEVEAYRDALERRILSDLDPAELGLRFEPVREKALQGAANSQDFGGLFIGFSLFLIAAALILMALLFQFGLEQRSGEIGTLLAVGFRHSQVRRLLLGEGAALAFIGGVLGTVGGVFYARMMMLGLTTIWRDAVGGTALQFFVTPGSLIIGLLASTVVAVLTIRLALRSQTRRPAIELLLSQAGGQMLEMREGLSLDRRAPKDGVRRRLRILKNAATVGMVSLLAAAALVGWALGTGETSNAGVFFGAGALVLIGGLAVVSWRLRRLGVGRASIRSTTADTEPRAHPGRDFALLGLRGAARRRSRSVATAALLACGSFLILSIGVFRLDANRDATERTSGTGGFALIGESTIPIVQDLNTTAGREFFALSEQDLVGVDFVQFRVHAGDEASCLNLNRAQQPRLMGVLPQAMDGRFTFVKVAPELERADGWGLLKSEMESVPAIGDAASIQWAMGKKVGDTIDYVDGQGHRFKVRIVGAVANSILQGTLIISDDQFVKRFPNESGHRYLLVDAPTNRLDLVSATLSRALEDYGLEITPAARRLNQFNAVQNTYLGTFQILGGLGLLLGSAGLGIVVLRNVLERRGELAVLMAVGFRKRRVERLVLVEHAGVLGLGLAVGLCAAVVAVLPALISPGSQLPYATLGPTLLAVLANGLIWTWAATRTAMRGNVLDALRNE